jgi:hypothetical protein
MTQDEIIEMAIQGHAGTRDAIRWAINQVVKAEREALAQTQEPVADDFFRMIADKNPKPFPLPQRTWVGLTEEEMHDCWGTPLTPYGLQQARAMEAKLKELNDHSI